MAQHNININDTKFSIEFNSANLPDRLSTFETPKSDKFYEEFYESSDNYPLAKVRHLQFEKILKIFKSCNLDDLFHKNVIDVGAGQGLFVKFLRNHFPNNKNIIGIEPYNNNNASYIKKTKLEDLEEKFDLLFMLDVFEHFENPIEVKDNIVKNLIPGGVICLKVPNKDSLLYQISKSFKFLNFAKSLLARLYQVEFPPPHYYYYNRKSLTEILSKEFEIITVDYIDEAPIGGIWQRLWGINSLVKPLVFIFLFTYSLITFGKLKDGLLIIAKKKELTN